MKKKVFIFWSLLIAIVIFRLWQSFGIQAPDIGNCLRQNIEGIGKIIDEPERKDSGQILTVSVSKLSIASTSENCVGQFLIRLKTKLYPQFYFSEEISFKGKILQPFNFNSNGSSFDYKNFLAKDNIYYEIKSATVSSIVEKVGEIESVGIFQNLQEILFSLKRRFVDSLKKNLGEPHAALAAGLVVGEKSALGKKLLDDFRTVGLIHIVVLSGYNITIVADSLRRVFSFLPRVWGILAGGIGLSLFGILVGGGATVVRSCLMASIALFAETIRRDYNVFNALILAGLIMVIQNPKVLLFDPSFKLSFLATLGLIMFANPIEEKIKSLTERFGIRSIISSTIATQLFVTPYLLYTMGRFSIIGVIANILILPLIPLTMLSVFLTGIAGMFCIPLAQFLGWGSHLLLSYELFIVDHFSDLSFASVGIKKIPIWLIIGFYILLLAIYFFFKKRNNNKNK